MRCVVLMVALCWAMPLAGAQAEGVAHPPPRRPAPAVLTPQLTAGPTNLTATISTRHFRVLGLESIDNARWAVFAEEVADRIERCLPGSDWTGDRQPHIRIELRHAPDQPTGRAIPSQRYYNGILDQRLLLLNPERVQREDFIEALCWLACNRRARTEQVGTTLVETPEWLSVGLAQNLYSELQQRNRKVALQRWQQGRRTAWTDLLRWRLLPEGRWADKAVCGVAFAWLRTWPDRADMVRALNSPPPAALDWCRRHSPQPGKVEALEQHWDQWVLHGGELLEDLGELTRRQTDALRALLVLQPVEFKITGTNVPARVAAADLIPKAREPWAQALAQAVPARLTALGASRPTEFQEVLTAYAAFFETLADPPRSGWLRRLFHFRPSRRRLTRLLADADRRLAALEHLLDQRQQYLSQAEQRLQPGAPQPAPAATNAPAATQAPAPQPPPS